MHLGHCWEDFLFLTWLGNRTQALHKHRPISLFATISVPTLNQESPLRQTYMSFTTLCELYRPFDERFFAHWNKVRTGCDAAWLAQMQDRLSQPLSPYLEPTESQEVYLRISQAWLQTMVWQLCVVENCLSSAAVNACMTFHYPIDISGNLVSIIEGFSQKHLEVHGVGLVSTNSSHIRLLRALPFSVTFFFLFSHPTFLKSCVSNRVWHDLRLLLSYETSPGQLPGEKDEYHAGSPHDSPVLVAFRFARQAHATESGINRPLTLSNCKHRADDTPD